MSKVMYFGVPAHGHTNPSLPVIEELVKRGEEVRYYTFPEFKEKILDTGAEYVEYRGFPTLVDNALLLKSFVLLVGSLIYATKFVVDNLIEDIKQFKPDYIIHDSICVWGSYAAKVCSVPRVTSISTFVFTKEITSFKDTASFIAGMSFKDFRLLIKLTRGNKKIARRLGIKHNDFISNLMNLSPLNLCYTIKELQPNSHKLDSGKFKFVGPSVSKKLQEYENEFEYEKLKKPLIYISLGTIIKSEKFFLNCGKALQDFPGTVIFSVGSRDMVPIVEKLNSDFIVRERVNQLNVLRNTDVFITAGGMNSVHESLMLGVPLCVFPFQAEQKSVAQAVVLTECGVQIKKIEPQAIDEAVQLVLNNKSFKQNCLGLSKKFISMGGYATAADAIEQYKRSFC
jgi:MGT family glycosyltransferase